MSGAGIAPIRIPAAHSWSLGIPKFMDMNLFSPMGFMSFIGFVIVITLPLWALFGLAFKGGLWYIKNKK